MVTSALAFPADCSSAHMHSPPPNKVCRTTRQHIPAQDTSGLKASSSKPRHLCQSHHHAGTSTQSSSRVKNVSKQFCNHMGLTAATARVCTIRPTVGYKARTCSHSSSEEVTWTTLVRLRVQLRHVRHTRVQSLVSSIAARLSHDVL